MITFFRKQFHPSIINSSVYIQEMVAVEKVVKTWRHYLISLVCILCILQSLPATTICITFSQKRVQKPEQQKYICPVLGYKYTIIYTPRKQNTIVDALSHHREEPTTDQESKT